MALLNFSPLIKKDALHLCKFLVASGWLFSCATSQLSIVSEPAGAAVTIVAGSEEKKLGVTPLELAGENIPQPNSPLRVVLPGYQETFVLLGEGFGGKQNLQLKLQRKNFDDLLSSSKSTNLADLQRFANDLVTLSEAPNLAADEGAALFVKLEPSLGGLAAFHKIKGRTYLKGGKSDLAKAEYLAVLKYLPEDAEAKNTIQFLSSIAP